MDSHEGIDLVWIGIYLYIAGFFGLIAFGILNWIAFIIWTIFQLEPCFDEFISHIKLYRRMETVALEAQASLKGSQPIDDKIKHLTTLKQEIKHRSCPERAVPIIFNVIRLALATPHVVDTGFSILGHLTKRLLLQDLHSFVHNHTLKLFPVLLDRLGDARDRLRTRAIAALTDFYSVSEEARKDVEQYMRDSVLTNKNPRAKLSAMQWILEMHKERGMLFRAFVPNLVNCLEDADGYVRQTAQATVIDLFQKSSMKSKQDLQNKMRERGVRKGIESHILNDLDIESSARKVPLADNPATPASVAKREIRPLVQSQHRQDSAEPPIPAVQPMSIAEQESAALSPIYVESARDVEETFREMHPWFEGKEAESNWLKREKSIEKLRRITKGNAPQEFTTVFLANIKTMLDGILKTINSLRTTVCTIGCHLVQDLARICGSGLDNMVEVLLQNLIKLCGNTKKIAATKANDTVSALMANVSYHLRLLQHIGFASQDKNAQPRTFACGWLKIVLSRSGNLKHSIEHSGGLEVLEKVIKTGLNDSNPGVRENMRPVYWTFAKIWSDKSEAIMSTLSSQHQDMLIKHPANPYPQATTAVSGVLGKPTLSKSTSALNNRPSIKEAIAAQKRAKAAGRELPERPGSAAETSHSPTKAAPPARPATAMSTTSRSALTSSTGNLSSAPVRPRRRPDIVKAATDVTTSTAAHEDPPILPNSPSRKATQESPTKASKANLERPVSPFPGSIKGGSPQKGSAPRSKPRSVTSPKPDRPSPIATHTTKDEELTQILPDFSSQAAQPVNNQFKSTFAAASRIKTPEKAPSTYGVLAQQSGSPLKSHEQTAEEDEQSRTRQGSPRRSPHRLSKSPNAIISSKKEAMQQRALNYPDPRTLKVYEDPDDDGADDTLPMSHVSPKPRALGELPVNEPLNRIRNASEDDFKLVREEHNGGPHAEYHSDWRKVMSRQSKRISREGEKFDNPLQAQKMLQSGINRIAAKALDVHGFRKLQSIIAFAPKSIWEEGNKLHELIVPLCEQLEQTKFDDVHDAIKDLDVKTQILVTIKLLHCTYPAWLQPYYMTIVTACISARKFYHPSTHMVAGLEDTVEELLHQCAPLEVIKEVLDLVEVDTENLTKNMSCYVIGGQLHKCHRSGLNPPVARIGDLATKCLESLNPDVRRAAVEMSIELYYNVTEGEFWALLSGVSEEYKGLVNYYLVRHQKLHKA